MIVDEQHRFGVHQRLALREKGEIQGYFPRKLIMTAPIPRTLAMTAYADLETSVIDDYRRVELPLKPWCYPIADRTLSTAFARLQ